MEAFTLDDLHRIYINLPGAYGQGTVTLTVAEMSDRQFCWWVKEKAKLEGIRMILPIGRVGHETRLYMLNRMAQHGVKIYKLADPKPER